MSSIAIPILPARVLNDSVVFYEALGFACTLHQTGDAAYAILRHPDGRELHLFTYAELDPGTNYAGCYWRVADVEALHRQSLAALGQVPSAPADRAWGMREFHLMDPSGNLLRIGQPLRVEGR